MAIKKRKAVKKAATKRKTVKKVAPKGKRLVYDLGYRTGLRAKGK